jgi:hypothetical protein
MSSTDRLWSNLLVGLQEKLGDGMALVLWLPHEYTQLG